MTTRLPSIDSQEFKTLHYKEQLHIFNLYLYDREKYLQLVGITPDELKYVDRSIASILQIPSEPNDDRELPVSFVEGCWCAYIANFNPLWWEEGFSPIDDVGLSHKRIFGIQLFDFPLISMDRTSSQLFRWLRDQPKKTRELNDIFYYLIKLRAAWEYFRDNERKPVDIWNLSIVHLNKFLSIADINESYPITEDSDLLDLIEEDTLVPLSSQVRLLRGRTYVPLVPSELYNKTSFKIKAWDFLLQR